MKKINVRCMTNDSLDGILFHIVIYDTLNNIFYDDYFYDIFLLELNDNELYKLIVIPPNNYYPNMICSSIIAKDLDSIEYFFRNDIMLIKVNLVDQYYQDLPIEKGKIILWQDHIQ